MKLYIILFNSFKMFLIFQAGDRYDFTGTLIVVPDVGSLSLPGGQTQIGSRHKRPDETEGVRGLKALGVRDLHYRMAFLACSVQPTTPKFGGIEMPLGEITPEIMKQQMTDGEWKHMYDMSHDRNLYQNMINSLFPSIHGNDEVKKGILLMLFGGVSKTTIEGTSLRGDINCCIVGDPSTAKSQFLKQVMPSFRIYNYQKNLLNVVILSIYWLTKSYI